MEIITRSNFETALETVGLDIDKNLRESYTGRNFAKPGVAITHSEAREFFEFLVALADIDHDAAVTVAQAAHQDNMGYDIITYFPGVCLTDPA